MGEVIVLSTVWSTYHDSLGLQQLGAEISFKTLEKQCAYMGLLSHTCRETSPLVVLVRVPNLLKAIWVVWSFHGVF